VNGGIIIQKIPSILIKTSAADAADSDMKKRTVGSEKTIKGGGMGRKDFEQSDEGEVIIFWIFQDLQVRWRPWWLICIFRIAIFVVSGAENEIA
jgi:hypothetical protein